MGGTSTSAYRPPQWSQPAQVSITQVPIQGQSDFGITPVPGAVLPATGPVAGQAQYTMGVTAAAFQTTYVFDAVLELEHEQRLVKTSHPVQTGADISSHAYLMPPKLTMYIGMSDAMDAYASGVNAKNSAGNATPDNVTPFSGTSKSKSVNAYQTMISLQAARQPLTVTTRLRTYTNMLITGVSPREDYKTIAGLRMRVEFEQVFTATTATAAVNGSASLPAATARPDATQQTALGQVNPSTVPSTTQTQFQIPQQQPTTSPALLGGAGGFAPSTLPPLVNVPGAGNYSSLPGQTGLP